MRFHLPLVVCVVCLAASAIDIAAQPPSSVPIDGLREHTPSVYALTNVRIVPEPGKVIEKGTIVFKDGIIVAAAADAAAAGQTVTVVTADRELRARTQQAGCDVVGPKWLLDRL